MLVLSRKLNESIVITASNGERIVVTYADLRNQTVRIGIDAPKSVSVNREEVQRAIDEGRAA